MADNFKDDPQKASDAGRKGGEHSHEKQQRESPDREKQEGSEKQQSSGERGGSAEQHSEARKQSRKNG